MLLAAGAAAVFVVTSTFWQGGLLDSHPWGDVGHYETLGEETVHGLMPYGDFYVEYPPGAIPAFALPAVKERHTADPFPGYLFRFKLLMCLCGLATLALVAVALRLLDASPRRTALALGAVAVTPAALGPVYLNRYDPWATLPLSGALVALLLARESAGGGLLGAAFATKLFSPVAAPLAAVRLARERGLRAPVRGLVWGAVVATAAFGYFLVAAFGGIGFSVYTQLRRGLQSESLGASILLAADRLGIYHAHIVGALSIDLGGGLADAVAVLTSLVGIAVVLAIALRYARGPEHPELFVAAFAATIVGFTVFSKVFSQQYMTWLVPFVPLVRGYRGLVASVLLVACLAMTQIEPRGFNHLHIATWLVFMLLARNVLLLVVLALVAAAVREPQTEARQAALRL